MKKHPNIEELFQESFKDFEADPGPNTWSAIQSGVHGSSAAGAIASKAAFSWVSAAVVGVSISAVAIAGYFFFNQEAEQKQEVEILPEQPTVAAPNQEESPKEVDKSKTSEEFNQSELKSVSTTNEKANNEILDKAYNASKEGLVDQEAVAETIENSQDGQTSAEHTVNANTEQDFSKTVPENDLTETKLAETESASSAPAENSLVTESENSSTAAQSSVAAQDAPSDIESTPNEAAADKAEVIAPNLYLPNYFSPNFDGQNDVFIIKSEEVDKMKIQIFSAMGSQKSVFEQEGENRIEWDGRLPDGTIAPKGQYYYVLSLYKGGNRSIKKGGVRILE